jgi:hypothetical protein
MPIDPEILAANRRAAERIHVLGLRLDDEALRHPVGAEWTVAITLAHLDEAAAALEAGR